MVRNDPDVTASPHRKPGRPGSLLSLDPSVGAVIGIDIDHERLTVLVADAAHTVLAEDHRTLQRDHEARDVMRLTSRLVDLTVQRAGVEREQVAGAGVGLAGPVDLVTGRVHPSSIAPSWQFVDARKELEGLLGLPVYIDNDANLGALAEMTWGVGRGVSEAAYVKVDTGVGVGIVVAGRVYRGATGTAGEIGHTTVDENGPVCRCGNRGCLEGLIGTAALVESLRTRYRADLTMDDVLRSAADGDVGCRRALADAGRQLGVQVGEPVQPAEPPPGDHRRQVVGGGRDRVGAASNDVRPPCASARRRNGGRSFARHSENGRRHSAQPRSRCTNPVPSSTSEDRPASERESPCDPAATSLSVLGPPYS